MDKQYWLYIILTVVYIISQMFKKKAKEGELESDETYSPENEPRSPQKGMSFEELLEEITRSKSPEPQLEKPVKQTFVDYDDDVKDEIEDIEKEDFDYRNEDQIYDTYEKAKREAFLRPSLGGVALDEESKTMDFGKFKEFSIKKRKVNPYLDVLMDSNGLKKAFIWSEILKRKF